MNCLDKEGFVNQYRELYFTPEEYNVCHDYKGILGVDRPLNTTDRGVEKYIYDELINNEHVIKKQYIMWKSGRLTTECLEAMKSADIAEKYSVKTGRGKVIAHFDEYMQEINGNYELMKTIDGLEIESAYKILLDLNRRNEVSPFGSVYILTLMFFLSGGKLPIYDKYAHTAVKALFLTENPKDVFVGEAPDKNDVDKVLGMYKEYRLLLREVFCKENIEREVDQALWVYGHSKKMYGEEYINRRVFCIEGPCCS